MRFGGSRLPMRLRVARTILYCQAAIMVLIAALALEVLIIGGASTGISLTGSGVTVLALLLVVIGIALVVVEQQVTARGAGARPLLAVAEIALAVYLIGFMTNSVETWVFGPAAGAAVLLLHYWPELHAYFFGSGSATPASADPPVDGDRPAGASDPNSDVTARPHL